MHAQTHTRTHTKVSCSNNVARLHANSVCQSVVANDVINWAIFFLFCASHVNCDLCLFEFTLHSVVRTVSTLQHYT